MLRETALRVSELTRTGDVLARQGGDEFLLLLDCTTAAAATDVDAPAATDPRAIAQIAGDRISAALERPFEVSGAEFHVGASIGVALFPEHADDQESLFKAADAAMYQAKRAGGGTVAFYEPRESDARQRLSLTTRLRRAIDEGELRLHYQPIVQVADGSLDALEASGPLGGPGGGADPAGRVHPRRGGDRPDRRDRRVGRRGALPAGRRVGGGGLRARALNFNLSPRQLRRADLVSSIAARISSHRLDPGQFCAELTETALLSDARRQRSLLTELNEAGLAIAIDDFGAGHSSLGRLRDLPVQVLKVDRSFLARVPEDAGSASIVAAVLDLGRALGMTTVIEGVEQPEQLAFLRAHGCPLVQGFLTGRPVPPEQLVREPRSRLGGFVMRTLPEVARELDTTWLVVAAVLVMFMQAGFACLEIGFSRGKNAGTVVAKILLNFSIASLVWWMVGFGLAFGGGLALFGDSGFFLSIGHRISDGSPIAGTFDAADSGYVLFQLVFCAVSLAIVWGTTLERIRFVAYPIYATVFAGLIYPLVAHWIFGGGWLDQLGAGMQDFAGSTVVHLTGATGGLAALLLLGPRRGKYGPGRRPRAIPGHSMPIFGLGVLILWLGWFGFNAGSTIGTGGSRFAEIALVTNLAAAAGVVGAAIAIAAISGRIDIGMVGNGAIGALVAITAPCGFVELWAAPIIGAVAGALGGRERARDRPRAWMTRSERCRAHGVGRRVGDLGVRPVRRTADRRRARHPRRSRAWSTAAASSSWACRRSACCRRSRSCSCSPTLTFAAIKATVGLRVTEVEEREGLDIVEHGMYGYPEQFMGGGELGDGVGALLGDEVASAPADRPPALARVAPWPISRAPLPARRVRILGAGGTIAMGGPAGATPQLDAEALVAAIPGLARPRDDRGARRRQQAELAPDFGRPAADLPRGARRRAAGHRRGGDARHRRAGGDGDAVRRDPRRRSADRLHRRDPARRRRPAPTGRPTCSMPCRWRAPRRPPGWACSSSSAARSTTRAARARRTRRRWWRSPRPRPGRSGGSPRGTRRSGRASRATRRWIRRSWIGACW